MQNWKQTFKRMNLDSDVRSMQPGDYRKLTNGTPIQPYSSSYQNAVQDIISNVIGNQLVANSLPSGTNKTIGFLQDRKSNRAFFCVWNSTPANNSIYQYSGATGVITLVMRTALFDWAQTDFVDMDIVGDVLIFTNNRSDIKKINVAKAIAGGTYTPLATEITLIKPPPLAPLTWTLGYDNSTSTNFIAGNYFQFFYRYVYEDYDYSVFNPSSLVSNGWVHPSGVDVDEATTVNTALVGLIALDGSYPVNDGDRVLLLGQTTTTENGIWIKHAGAWTRAADFPAAGNKDITVYVSGGLTNFSQVWRIVSPNIGTIQINSFRLEGPNYLTINRPVTPPATVIQIEYAVRINGSNEFTVYKIERLGAFTSSHTFYNTDYLFTVPDADTFVFNDNIPLTTKSLKIFKNRLFLFNNTEGYTHNTTTKVALQKSEVTPTPATINRSTEKVVRVAKNGGRYNVGVMFFDAQGRTSGVKCENTITIPEGTLLTAVGFKRYVINVDLTPIASDVPSWAVRGTVVCTKELTTSFFLSQITQDIYYYNINNAGVYTYSKTLASFDAQGTLIDIGALVKERKGYTFQKGDRIKLYDNNYDLDSTVNIIDVEILGQVGNFVMTRVITELNSKTMLTSGSSNVIFEIYTPQQLEQAPFFETGLSMMSGVANIEGDIELGVHVTYGYVSGGYSATNPYANKYITGASGYLLPQVFLTEDMSIWNKNFPQWITSAGRSSVKSDSRQINKYTNIRFGQQYTLNSNFLGLNTFYALDEQALPIENGAGTRLAEAGEVLVAIHEVETEAVYVGQGFVKTDNGANQFLTKTDNVIGDVRRYQGGYGSFNQASVVSREGKVYYVDRRQGCIIRRAQDGLTVISDNGIRGLVSTLCAYHDTLATSRIIGGWDPQYDCYCVSFIDTAGPTGITLYWHEDSNGWVFQTNMMPELWGILNQDQFSFLNGQLWAQSIEGNYNKFYGVQYDRLLEMEFSPLRSLIHIWDAIEIDVESIYTTGGSNEDVVLLYHKNGDTLQTKINYADFKQRESDRVWRSAFFRWLNDANFTGPNATVLSKYNSAKRIRGQSAFMTIKYKGTDINPMKSVTIFYTPSMQSAP